MGFMQAAVLSSVSFFLGVLFICFNIDRTLLFQTLTDKSIADAFQFYTTFYDAPLAVKGLMHAMIGMGILGLVGKLNVWDESAIFFDGSSLALYVIGVIIYTSVTIAGLRTIVYPGDEDTESDRIEALRILSAGNTLIILCLVGVLLLQGGQEYARRVEAKAVAKLAAEPVAEEKKTQ
ncbi:Shr3 amino acid permease chaperone [Gautieria morchelliformis]|nr:Shr3 amino acid permease chaperone [Gautieria morchelliformis]